MKNAIIRDGKVANIVKGAVAGGIDISRIDPSPCIGWSYDEHSGSFTPAQQTQDDLGTKISKLAFNMRLTAAERKAIRVKARTDDDVTDFIELMNAASVVDLSHPLVVSGLGALKTLGVLDQTRVDAILNTPVTQEELP